MIGNPSQPALADAVQTLKVWLFKGAHRIDKNKDGHYDDERAVQIMDAWWPRAVERMFKNRARPDRVRQVHAR